MKLKSIHLCALVLVLVAEFAFFDAMIVRRQAWIYPRWFDQVQYLTEAYRGYERAQDAGIAAGVRETLTNIAPQGTLHDFWALGIFLLFGPSREGALAVNLLALVILQAVTFFAARRLADSWPAAWIGLAFMAALQCGWVGGSGSIADFRLDWMAACAYGVALGVAMAGDGFRSVRRAALFGGAVGLVLLTRHLTAVYFAAVYVLFLGVLLVQSDRRARIGRLVLSGVVALAIAGPSFWHNRAAIYGYYWGGHVAGPERALRDPHLGPWASIEWLSSELLLGQVGWAALVLMAGAAGALAVGRRFSSEAVPAAAPSGLREAWITAGIFLVAPAAVLAEHTLKAAQPVSILAPTAAWFGILACVCLMRRTKPRVAGGVAVLAGAGALLIVITGVARTRPSPAEERAAERIVALADYVYDRAEECGLERPRLAVTWILDGVNGPTFRVLGYERHQRWRQIDETLPTGLFEATRETVFAQLAQSDFVCLLTGASADATPWPFNRQMIALQPALREWCEANLRRVDTLELEGMPTTLYERRSLRAAEGAPGVELAKLLQRSPDEVHHLPAPPPGPPRFPPAEEVLWSVQAECTYPLQAIYGPVRYQVRGLPDGLAFDERRSRLVGRFAHAGTFPVEVTARNAVGTATTTLLFRVEAASAVGEIRAPSTAVVGRPIAIDYRAFDAAAELNLIDVVDATTGQPLGRLEAGEDEHQRWSGRYETTFTQPGRHTVLFRITRFSPKEKIPYTFFDRSCEIDVAN